MEELSDSDVALIFDELCNIDIKRPNLKLAAKIKLYIAAPPGIFVDIFYLLKDYCQLLLKKIQQEEVRGETRSLPRKFLAALARFAQYSEQQLRDYLAVPTTDRWQPYPILLIRVIDKEMESILSNYQQYVNINLNPVKYRQILHYPVEAVLTVYPNYYEAINATIFPKEDIELQLATLYWKARKESPPQAFEFMRSYGFYEYPKKEEYVNYSEDKIKRLVEDFIATRMTAFERPVNTEELTSLLENNRIPPLPDFLKSLSPLVSVSVICDTIKNKHSDFYNPIQDYMENLVEDVEAEYYSNYTDLEVIQFLTNNREHLWLFSAEENSYVHTRYVFIKTLMLANLHSINIADAFIIYLCHYATRNIATLIISDLNVPGGLLNDYASLPVIIQNSPDKKKLTTLISSDFIGYLEDYRKQLSQKVEKVIPVDALTDIVGGYIM